MTHRAKRSAVYPEESKDSTEGPETYPPIYATDDPPPPYPAATTPYLYATPMQQGHALPVLPVMEYHYIPPLGLEVTYRDWPMHVICQYCAADVRTSTHYRSGCMTYLLCGLLTMCGCFLGCCLVPFCIDGCKDVIHTCPNCDQVVGHFERLR